LKDGQLGSQDTSPVRPAKVKDILLKPKKGSKSYRLIISAACHAKKALNQNIMKKFLALSGIDTLPVPIPVSITLMYNEGWCQHGASNKLREFVFKFNNNLLALNSRVSHFNRFVSEECTFCVINRLAPAPRESFSHLFFDCPESNSTLTKFEEKYLNDMSLNSEEKRRQFWFLGANPNNLNSKNKFLQMTASVILLYIWDCKLWKVKQSFAGCLNFYFYHCDTMRKVSNKFKAEMNGTNLDLCRYWDGERPRGW
jgi:hypothetical protein